MSSQEHLQTMTADEFLALPESNLPHELIEGVLYVAPAPEVNHQLVSLDVSVFLRLLKTGRPIASPIDVRLDNQTVVQPDIIWFTPESTIQTSNRKYIEGIPDLVVEILSPGTARRDRSEKYELYEKHGVKDYWIIDIDGHYLEAFSHNGDQFVRMGVFGPEHTFQSPVLQAQVPIADFFASLDTPE